ncbi:hypothetical protein [Gordonia sp. NPDC003950]
MRTSAIGHPIAMTAAILIIRRLGVAAVEPDVRADVLTHLELIHGALDRVDDQVDAEFCRGEIDEARTAIAAAWAV